MQSQLKDGDEVGWGVSEICTRRDRICRNTGCLEKEKAHAEQNIMNEFDIVR